jgi:nucleotide-binding universal stress UspA family protein
MRVLLGIVDGATAEAALAQTLERAREAGDRLTVVVLEEACEDPDAVAGTVRDRLAETSLDASVRRVGGDPGSELVRLAESGEFDEVALSGGETSPMGKINIGSVAEFVLLNSHVTVKLIR